MAKTDANGVARFNQLQVIASSSRSVVLSFYCGGNFDLWNQVLPILPPPPPPQGTLDSASEDPLSDSSSSLERERETRLLVKEVALVDPEDAMRGTGGDTLHQMRAVPRDTIKERPWETRGKSVEGESMENVWVQVGNPVDSVASLRVWPAKGKRVIAVASPYYSKDKEQEVYAKIGVSLGQRAMLEMRKWKRFKVRKPIY